MDVHVSNNKLFLSSSLTENTWQTATKFYLGPCWPGRKQMNCVAKKPLLGVSDLAYTNQAVQPYKMARGLKLRI